ncbi:aminoglycoside phosphotransferase family protein [Paractinoplanes rishiriensis]|uniref:Trifolitoxin immunity domain-containing protein n=1 Tax=Paractinoplanes rishiriensis TaxID=1050105 RepID=A0A919MU66_9ACTN|nr:aminoglycoside phosphotransferase family protein [Actinoplanes rishiriensis]GIF00012.1 trifolitoxin immunity domain-containing protein [Actinoplanes rishiriensis]
MTGPEVLQDTPHRRVVRVGDTVRRPLHPWSPAIHELLRHLEAVGFPHAPRVLGIDAEGREVLTYLEGDSGPQAWARVVDESGLVGMARLLRDLHAAVREFRPRGDAVWAGRVAAPRAGELICHGDFGPWNLVWRGTRPVGILDWDYAWPNRPLHDVAYALEYVAPFRPDDECVRWLRYPGTPDRRRRVELFAEAYGLTSTDGLVDEVIAQQQQVLDRARRLAAEGREPQLTWERDGVLTETAARITWSRQHRHLFTGGR